VDGFGKGVLSSALYRKTILPNPVPAPVSMMLLKMRKTSLTVVKPGSVRITSPAMAPKGNCNRMFSGIWQAEKLGVQAAICAPDAGTARKLTTLKHSAANAKRYLTAGVLLRIKFDTSYSKARIF
jgi:hypothetical protein